MTWTAPKQRQLLAAPRSSAGWQCGTVGIGVDVAAAQEGVPCLCVQGDGFVRASLITLGAPTAADWASLLYSAVLSPLRPGRPMRPGRVRVVDAALAAELTPLLRPLQVTVEVVAALPELDRVGADLAEAMAQAGGRISIGDEERTLFAAAAAYVRLTPWQCFHSEPVFALTTEVAGWPAPIAVIMGGMGETFGLSVFRSEDAYAELAAAIDRGERTGANDSVAAIFVGSREVENSERKRAAARKLEVVPGRFPIFTRSTPGRAPTDLHAADQYRILTAALRAVAAWVERAERDGDAHAEQALDDGRLRVVLTNPAAYGLESLHEPVRAATQHAVATSFLRIEDEAVVAALRQQLPAAADVRYLPVLTVQSTSVGLADLEPILTACESLRIVLLEGEGWALVADTAGGKSTLLAAVDTPWDVPAIWTRSAAKLQGNVLLAWFEGDGKTPQFTWDTATLRGRRGIRLDLDEVAADTP